MERVTPVPPGEHGHQHLLIRSSGAEAAYLWTQMLRAFRTLCGSWRFVINAYQFGAGNAGSHPERRVLVPLPAWLPAGSRCACARWRAREAKRHGVRSPLSQRRAHAEGARHRRFVPRPARLRSGRFFRRSVVACRWRAAGAPVGERALSCACRHSGAWPTRRCRRAWDRAISADGPGARAAADSNSWRRSSRVLARCAAGAPPSVMQWPR